MSKIWENIFRKKRNADSIEEILVKIPIFQDLTPRELKTIKSILYQREYKTNEFIFKEGDAGLGMYIIFNGKVIITCGNDKQTLAELEEGDFFGELSLLDESPRSASAVAKTPCILLCFFKPELLDIIERNPKLGCKIIFKLAWTIGERLKSTNEQLKALNCQSRKSE
ncbi:MAG: cyclic nucleotide-binding domain-containing protein [Nitrospirae bacterium]|jgi:CRP-like cAMP-binding protein|nr:cyclic nucleotide-binding domain-containing protein [Nitrospirota bacterium]